MVVGFTVKKLVIFLLFFILSILCFFFLLLAAPLVLLRVVRVDLRGAVQSPFSLSLSPLEELELMVIGNLFISIINVCKNGKYQIITANDTKNNVKSICVGFVAYRFYETLIKTIFGNWNFINW